MSTRESPIHPADLSVSAAMQSAPIKQVKSEPEAMTVGRQRYLIALLLLIYVFGFIDRQIVNILGETLKRELNILNWEFGLLAGLAFSVLYTSLGLPLALLADKGYRVRIIVGSVTVWSLFTVACGFASNFTQLLLMRVGVGVGEAGGTPASHALISNAVMREKRATALAIFSMGVPIGTLLGMVIGGIVADAYGWRAAFIVAGAPGLLLGLVAWLTLREVNPPLEAPRPRSQSATFIEIAKIPAVRWIIAAVSANTFAFFGVVAFSASFFLRLHRPEIDAMAAALGLKAQGALGLALGLSLGLGGLVGTYAGGVVADRFAKSGVSGYLLVPMLISACYIPLGLIGFTADSIWVGLLCVAGCGACGIIFYGPSFAALHSIVRPELRASTSAATLATFNLLGYGLGPLVVGAMNDFWVTQGATQGEGLRYALITICVVGGIASTLFYFVARRITSGVPVAPPVARS